MAYFQGCAAARRTAPERMDAPACSTEQQHRRSLRFADGLLAQEGRQQHPDPFGGDVLVHDLLFLPHWNAERDDHRCTPTSSGLPEPLSRNRLRWIHNFHTGTRYQWRGQR